MDTGQGVNGAHLLDAGAIGILAGVFTNILPAVATVLTIVWMVIRIIETDTLQKWFNRKSKKPPVMGGEDDADPV